MDRQCSKNEKYSKEEQKRKSIEINEKNNIKVKKKNQRFFFCFWKIE